MVCRHARSIRDKILFQKEPQVLKWAIKRCVGTVLVYSVVLLHKSATLNIDDFFSAQFD